MIHAIHLRAEQLLQLGRTDEAVRSLRVHLGNYPDDAFAKYLLAYGLLLSNNAKEARLATEELIREDPDKPYLLRLLVEIDIAEDQYQEAEQKAKFLLDMHPDTVESFVLLGRIKFLQRYYDAALSLIDRALALDASNLEALNLRVRITESMGEHAKARESIDELLQLNPEDPTTLANLGLQMVNDGKVQEALDVFAQALSIQPTNALVRYGMKEALKSKFVVYRLFYHYNQMMAKLDSRRAWIVIIGTYIAARIVGQIARNTSGFLSSIMSALVILVAVFFFLSWVINPLMNLYLSTNKYGRLLLDADEKKMGQVTGACLTIAFLCFSLFWIAGTSSFLFSAFLFLSLMIPAGTFLNPDSESKRFKLKVLFVIILISGLLGVTFPQAFFLLILSVLSLIGYQLYYNKLMINEFSRKFEN